MARTISSILSAGIDGFRPRPLRTAPKFANPSSSKRRRHSRTVTTDTPTSTAIRELATPSAASTNTCARCTSRCGAVLDLASISSVERWPSVSFRAGAAWFMTTPDHNQQAICEALHDVIYSVGIASLVVVVLAFTGSPAPSLAADRVLATYAVWPTWERTRVADRLADLVEIDGRYGAALLHAWADPAGADRAALQRLRRVARPARSNAEASVERWLSEPAGRQPGSPNTLETKTAQGILAAVRRYIWGALVLHGQLPSTGPTRPDRLCDETEQAMTPVVVAPRTGSAPTGYLPLRATQVALAIHPRGPSPQAAADPPPTTVDMVVVSETDLMVNAVDTLAHLVGLGPRSPTES